MIKLRDFLAAAISIHLIILLHASVISSQNKKRIVGGTPTTIAEVPYLVQLLDDGLIFCSGTLISKKHVLTAAHCFDKHRTSMSVVAGASSLLEEGIESRIRKIFIPLKYDNETYNADIAVVKLRKEFNDEIVRPISLCENNNFTIGDPVQVYGWGLISEDANSIPIQLQTVEVNIESKTICVDKYSKRHTLTDTMFCARAEGKDSCSGDSGGPAIVNGQVCGVVSFGIGCARSDSPGVYTDVKKLSAFIRAAMKQ